MSSIIQNALVGVVGLEHLYIFALETFMWGTKRFNQTFAIRQQDATKLKENNLDTMYVYSPILCVKLTSFRVKTLFQNQGFYNLVLAAGIFWSFAQPVREFARQLQIFFTGAVVACAVVGGITTGKPRILLVQGLPAALALLSVLLGW